MKLIQEHLANRQTELAQHPLFIRLRSETSFAKGMAFAPALGFWTFAFQDLLRMNEARVVDPELRKVARYHRLEDAGHDTWFVEDMQRLDNQPREFHWLFSHVHTTTREASYALVSEVFRLTDDRLRIVLLLALESAGRVFFSEVSSFVHTHAPHLPLRYFAHSHLAAEESHQLFDVDHPNIDHHVLEEPARKEALALVARVFDAFDAMFDGLLMGIRDTLLASPTDPQQQLAS